MCDVKVLTFVSLASLACIEVHGLLLSMESVTSDSILCKSRLNVDGTILVSLKTFYKAYNDGLPELLSEVILTKKRTVEFQK